MDIILKYFAEFTPRQLQQFETIANSYREWNEKINVISRKDIDGLFEKHILHSLSIAAVFEFSAESEIIDLGTGGGFPGIPLAIFFPEVKFHLVDSIAKKLKVVEAVAADAGIENVTVEHTRAEEIKNRKFDFVVSRAVAPLKELWQWSKPLLKAARPAVAGLQDQQQHKPGLICLKGGDLAAEIQESATRPRIQAINEIFPEKSFIDKYILYVPR